MELAVRRVGGDAVIDVGGEIDMDCADGVVQLARAVVGDRPPTRLVLDTSNVTFLDAAGLGAFVRLAALADAHGASFHLPQPSERVRRLLSIAGLSYPC